MIIITGAAGFIGSCLVARLNELGRTDLVLVDDFSRVDKHVNLDGKQFLHQVNRAELWNWLAQPKAMNIEAVIHLGARTDTSEQEWDIFEQLNVRYSQALWRWCVKNDWPLIYASSAATYGAGEHGFRDDHAKIPELTPLNPYGRSKQTFDVWALAQDECPPCWYGLKFFNVYGPNESHKGRMASVIFHAYHQILKTDKLRLFRSHRSDYRDGEQARDFIYVKDLLSVILFLLDQQPDSGIYNLGTGQARTFNDLAQALFRNMERPLHVDYIDTPLDIRNTYQYFTEAEMQKLRGNGFSATFFSLEEGLASYIREYLARGRMW